MIYSVRVLIVRLQDLLEQGYKTLSLEELLEIIVQDQEE